MEKFIVQLRKQKIANGYWRKILSHLGRKIKRRSKNNLEEKVDGAKKKEGIKVYKNKVKVYKNKAKTYKNKAKVYNII